MGCPLLIISYLHLNANCTLPIKLNCKCCFNLEFAALSQCGPAAEFSLKAVLELKDFFQMHFQSVLLMGMLERVTGSLFSFLEINGRFCLHTYRKSIFRKVQFQMSWCFNIGGIGC